MNYRNRNSSIKGFTLIELLVVVGIIGILAAVGTVAYSGYVFSSKLKSADNIMQQIALAQTEYYSDKGNYKNYGKSCTANKDNTESITTDLGVPIDYSTIEFYFCIEVKDEVNYTVKAKNSSAGSKSECEITFDNVSNKATRNDKC